MLTQRFQQGDGRRDTNALGGLIVLRAPGVDLPGFALGEPARLGWPPISSPHHVAAGRHDPHVLLIQSNSYTLS